MAFPYRSGMESWFEELRRSSQRGGFPGSASVLSRKIKPLKSAIRSLGYSLEISRNEDGATILIHKIDDGLCGQSSGSRQDSGSEKSESNIRDDDQAIIAKLSEQKRLLTKTI